MRIVPLGGLGEIGRNMNVIEYNGRILLIDCGVLFPEEEQPGVDLILPDFSYIKGKLDQVDALVLTHGHEDHIGGVPYLLKLRPDIPLIGSKLTLGFVDAASIKQHKESQRQCGQGRHQEHHSRPAGPDTPSCSQRPPGAKRPPARTGTRTMRPICPKCGYSDSPADVVPISAGIRKAVVL